MQLVIHCPVRQPGEPGLGAGAPEAVLPPVQLRAPGRGHRGRAAAVAGTAALLPAGHRLPVPPSRHGGRDPGAGAARRADVRHPLALERDHRARDAAKPGRPQGAAPDSADAGGGSPRRRLPRRGRLPGEHPGRPGGPRSSAGAADDRRLPARGDGSRRADRGAPADPVRARSATSRATSPSPRRWRTRS